VTALYVLREEQVPIEELRPGDRIVLPSGQRVTFDRLDEYDDGYVVRWWRRAEHGEPGHRGGKRHTEAIGDEWDGKYLSSLRLMRLGETMKVDRG